MISGEKILVTGASGHVGMKLGTYLARENEVWGLARYAGQRAGAMNTAPRGRDAVAAAGMRPVSVDLGKPDLSALPQDFTYVLHLSHTRRGPDEFLEAVDVNAIGAGKVLQHCRRAKAALVVSSTAVYSPPADVFTPLSERADIGRAWAPWAPTSPVSKVSLEAVARFCAEAFDLPVAVMRLNTLYGPDMDVMPVLNMDTVVAGKKVVTFADPYPHSPIHIDDMSEQLEALLDAAATPAAIINWCGDEVVTQRQWCDYAAAWSGKPAELVVNPIPGTPNGNVSDPSKRRSVTGPCRRPFEPSFRAIYEQRHGAPLA
ncbi:MAG: Epimerase [Phenylobacterium sp.]|nr:Epimerase [Phenylobacterium sp.]